MNDIQRRATISRDVIDGALRATIAALEAAFPGRIRGYYVEGSYADGTGVATSDLDLVVVFIGACDDVERARAIHVGTSRTSIGAVEFDVVVTDEAELARGAYPTLKLGSQCVYGEDIRDSLALLPIEEWTRQRMHAAYTLIVRVFDRPVPVRYPLNYPDPCGDYYGYDNRTVRLPDGRDVPSTRNLIRVTGWAATALLALRANVYVARKSDCHAAYRRHIGGEWSDLLDDLYRRCRTEWRYLIPLSASDRAALRELCRRALQFENHVLLVYRDYALSALRDGDQSARQAALSVLERTPYHDDAIREAIQAASYYT